MWLPLDVLKELEKLLAIPNVVGFSKRYKPRIRAGVVIPDEKCIRIYVKKKLPLNALSPWEILPKEILGIPVDVVEVGEIKALGKTDYTRPVVAGLSIGQAQITSGSFGYFYEDSKRNILGGTNAHVVSPNPFADVKELKDKRVLQPGPYFIKDDKNDPKYLIGEVVWYKKLFLPYESNCNVARSIAGLLNAVSKSLGRSSRFRVVSPFASFNHIDFGVFSLTAPYELKLYDMEKPDMFVGHIFAGSDTVGVICKVKYILNEGYSPVDAMTYEPKVGDKLKFTSMWCRGEVTVTDDSAVTSVSYGTTLGEAYFDDVILTDNPNQVIKGGCSGSGVWYV